NETAKVSIGATNSNTIGHTRFETVCNAVTSVISDMASVQIKLSGIDGYPNGYEFQTIDKATFLVDGYKAIAEMMNGVSDKTGVKATVNNTQVMSNAVEAGTLQDLTINGVAIGNITVKANDSDNALIAAINSKKDETGVEASLNNGHLVLAAKDGRAIRITTKLSTTASIIGVSGASQGTSTEGSAYLGQLTFVRQDARDIKIGIQGLSATVTNFSAAMITNASIASQAYNQTSVNLKYMNSGTISSTLAKAMGYFDGGASVAGIGYGDQAGGVNTYGGAQAMVDVAESARKSLDKLRADLGSVQNQLVATINNITVTQVNVKSAESQIRDVDFASESANFSKFNILAQSGSYAMSQANAVQQNILRLLQ
ncbi:flagellin, partial [Campylobacter lanienae]